MVKTVMRSTAVRVSILCSCCSCATNFLTSSDMVCSPSQKSFLSPINVHLERLRLSQRRGEQNNWTMVSTVPSYHVWGVPHLTWHKTSRILTSTFNFELSTLIHAAHRPRFGGWS